MSTSLLAEIPSSMAASLEAAEGREARGILFKILVADLKGARVPGAVAETTSEEAGGAVERAGSGRSPAGGLPEPAQRLLDGPWERIS